MDPLNLFISYSHADEKHLIELKKNLSVLEKNGLINIWSDKELVVGDVLDDEIKDKLISADLVVFLISSDFLDSYYCYQIELKQTLSRLPYSDIRVVPVIIRQCMWKETELKEYVAAPNDGKHLTTFNDSDEYWTEVVTAIKKAAVKLNEVKGAEEKTNIKKIYKKASLKTEFEEYLNDTQIKLNHKYKNVITLDDIYVYGDIKNIKDEYDEFEDVLSSKELANISAIYKGILLLGSEQIGKTSLLKQLYRNYVDQNAMPVLINGEEINSSDVRKLVGKRLSQQYEDLKKDEFFNSANIKILLVDDYDKIKLNAKHHLTFLANAKNLFDKIIVVADSAFKYDEHKYIEFSDFNLYEMLLFGNLRRSDLIDKWNSIGRIETIDDTELHNLNDSSMTHIEAILGKAIIPRKPFYIITILQFLEASSGSDLTLTSYGHCYQQLIQNQLSKVFIGYKEFDIYFNYLEALAFDIFKSDKSYLTTEEYEKFKKQYSNKHVIPSHIDVVNKLIESGILATQENKLYFGYRYFFYFYAAKYIADNVSHCKECRSIVEYLCENLHSEKNANTLIFLVHHSRDKHIIDEILLNAYAVFDGTEDAKLDYEETKHLVEYIASIPNLVFEHRNVDDERKNRLKSKDIAEGTKTDEAKGIIEEDEEDDEIETLNEINKSLRIIDLIGQIIRNRYGSLTREQLLDLTRSAYSSGLKLLNKFLAITREDSNQLLSFIESILSENTDLGEEQIAKEARKVFLVICYGASYSVIKRISHSVGTERLIEVFDQIAEESADSPAKQLINIAIKLEFTKKIPKDDIKELSAVTEKNEIVQRLLQEVVIQHLYLNHVDYKERQWISSALKLPVKSQRLIQSDKPQKE